VWTINPIDMVTNLPPADINGVPNLGGYAADFQVRTGPGAAVLLEASTVNGQITITNSAITITFPGATIKTQGSFRHELKLTDVTGVVSKPIAGVFLITPSITS
jgi:hypothetical protein